MADDAVAASSVPEWHASAESVARGKQLVQDWLVAEDSSSDEEGGVAGDQLRRTFHRYADDEDNTGEEGGGVGVEVYDAPLDDEYEAAGVDSGDSDGWSDVEEEEWEAAESAQWATWLSLAAPEVQEAVETAHSEWSGEDTPSQQGEGGGGEEGTWTPGAGHVASDIEAAHGDTAELPDPAVKKSSKRKAIIHVRRRKAGAAATFAERLLERHTALRCLVLQGDGAAATDAVRAALAFLRKHCEEGWAVSGVRASRHRAAGQASTQRRQARRKSGRKSGRKMKVQVRLYRHRSPQPLPRLTEDVHCAALLGSRLETAVRDALGVDTRQLSLHVAPADAVGHVPGGEPPSPAAPSSASAYPNVHTLHVRSRRPKEGDSEFADYMSRCVQGIWRVAGRVQAAVSLAVHPAQLTSGDPPVGAILITGHSDSIATALGIATRCTAASSGGHANGSSAGGVAAHRTLPPLKLADIALGMAKPYRVVPADGAAAVGGRSRDSAAAAVSAAAASGALGTLDGTARIAPAALLVKRSPDSMSATQAAALASADAGTPSEAACVPAVTVTLFIGAAH